MQDSNSVFEIFNLRGVHAFSGASQVVRASQVVLAVKNPLPMQEMKETWVPSLGWEDPPEEGMATHSSILAWRIP